MTELPVSEAGVGSPVAETTIPGISLAADNDDAPEDVRVAAVESGAAGVAAVVAVCAMAGAQEIEMIAGKAPASNTRER